MRSTDQCLDWRGNFGHLQLETTFMQAGTISAIANWMQSHTKERKEKLKQFEQQITDLGGTVLK
jgi:predicted metal-dependent RNase